MARRTGYGSRKGGPCGCPSFSCLWTPGSYRLAELASWSWCYSHCRSDRRWYLKTTKAWHPRPWQEVAPLTKNYFPASPFQLPLSCLPSPLLSCPESGAPRNREFRRPLRWTESSSVARYELTCKHRVLS